MFDRPEQAVPVSPEEPLLSPRASQPYRKPVLLRLGTLEDVQGQPVAELLDGPSTQGSHWYSVG